MVSFKIIALSALAGGLVAAVPAGNVANVARQGPLPVYCGDGGAPFQTGGDAPGGIGIQLQNLDSVTGTYFLYENSRDEKPWKYISLAPGAEAFISVCSTFQGRIVRGSNTNLDGRAHNLGTWAEISWKEDGAVWGDISLLEGCDGAVEWLATDGTGNARGFSKYILDGAPPEAYATKDSGARALGKTVGDANAAAVNWEKSHLSQDMVYIEDGRDANGNPIHPQPVINSRNGVVRIVFHAGTY